jgi:hypothetical protein
VLPSDTLHFLVSELRAKGRVSLQDAKNHPADTIEEIASHLAREADETLGLLVGMADEESEHLLALVAEPPLSPGEAHRRCAAAVVVAYMRRLPH